VEVEFRVPDGEVVKPGARELNKGPSLRVVRVDANELAEQRIVRASKRTRRKSTMYLRIIESHSQSAINVKLWNEGVVLVASRKNDES
jgi:hypothetical protein